MMEIYTLWVVRYQIELSSNGKSSYRGEVRTGKTELVRFKTFWLQWFNCPNIFDYHLHSQHDTSIDKWDIFIILFYIFFTKVTNQLSLWKDVFACLNFFTPFLFCIFDFGRSLHRSLTSSVQQHKIKMLLN